MAGELSTQQLLLLNNLMNAESPITSVQDYHNGATVGDIVRSIESNISNMNAGEHYGLATDKNEWSMIANAIKNDPELLNIRIVSTNVDSNGGVSALFDNPASNEAIVVFKGTTPGEWKDNIYGGGPTNAVDGVSTQQQERALTWYNSLELSDYDSVTVSGWSKGGNKAKYITIRDDSVDRCVSFDGQGFSDEFMEEYSAEIGANQNKIENHNLEYDYVNELLNDVGEKHYYEGQRIEDPAENHGVVKFIKIDNEGRCQMVPGEQSRSMQEVDEFINSILRSLEGEEKRTMLDLFADIAGATLGDSEINIKTIINRPEYIGSFVYFLAYFLKYADAYPEIIASLADFLIANGMEDLGNIIKNMHNAERIMDILDNSPYLDTPIRDAIRRVRDSIVDEPIIKNGKDITLPSGGNNPAQISVKIGELRMASEKFRTAAADMENIRIRIEKSQRQLMPNMIGVSNALRGSMMACMQQANTLARMAGVAYDVSENYQNTENSLLTGV